MNPSITVAVPACNGARHLRVALSSILRSETPHELLIVDDRSDDETLAIARELVGDRGRIEINSERLGLANNWNQCVSLSQTPLVAIFHQDDVMLPGHLARHLQIHATNPSIGWVASNVEVIDDNGDRVPESVVEPGMMASSDREYPAGAAIEALAVTNPLRCSGVTIGASAHAEVGGFDPTFRYVVDWDFWVRVAKVRPVFWLAKPTAAIRWHLASETHRFADGTVDLDETAQLLSRMADLVGPNNWDGRGRRLDAERRLARAFLNRAYVASKRGDTLLAQRALRQSFRLAPAQLWENLLLDPRLLARMALVLVAPKRVKRSNQTAVSLEGELPDRQESGDND